MHAAVKNIITGVVATMLLVSCQHAPVFIQYHTVEGQQWDRRDTMKFAIPAQDKDREVSVEVGIRTTNAFKYSNITAVVLLNDGKRDYPIDTLGINLFNEKGEALSQGFPFIETYVPTQKHLTLKKDTEYVIKISHIMRDNPVDGIYNVGVVIDDI